MKMKGRTILNVYMALAMVCVLGLAFALQACGDKGQKPDIKTEYQAILLQNGEILFGKIQQVTPSYIVVTDVYYTKSTVNPDTKQVAYFIIKRGKEWHSPEIMYINPSQVIMIESVGEDSQVVKSIREEKSKASSGVRP